MMKKPLLLLIILLSSPQNVASFARYPLRRPSKTKQASLSSVAYSFRQPDEDDAAYSEESISSILSNGDDENPTATNGSNTNDGISSKDELILDIVGSGTLGDIMSGTTDASAQAAATSSLQFPPITTSSSNNPSSSSSSRVIDGLVTKEGGELNTRFKCDFTPMERIALTSNGNLQRIFSSYYDAPVHVHIDFCERRSSLNDTIHGDDGSFVGEIINNDKNYNNTNDNAAIWDRIVHIHVHGQTICKATSIISVKDPVCIRLIEDGTVGLGQLFRYLNRLPTFSLVDAGRRSSSSRSSMAMDHPFSSSFNIGNDAVLVDSGMWRTYELKCDEMTCLIHEEFREDAWNISPLDSNGSDGPFQPMI